nr:RNA-directed DNA polymerase, eukaryota, reverse transcriptase zinc-binding domain protein [Tanacetum cinerariifolium]
MDKNYSFHCSPVPTHNEAGTEADNHNQIENHFHMNHTSKSRMWGVEGVFLALYTVTALNFSRLRHASRFCATNEAIPLSDEEIALDANGSSEGTMSPGGPRRSKAGKRFGFMRFFKVFDAESLVNNLCTIWVGRHKIHANVARFQRVSMNNSSSQFKKNEEKRNYSHDVYTYCLLGKVKEFTSLTNLKVVLVSEDFDNVKLRYMGGFWVMRTKCDNLNNGDDARRDSEIDEVPDIILEEKLPNTNDDEYDYYGDFNEVRNKAERFGSVFNVQGANAFNMFISSVGLEEVPLGGCSFTWCHKSATKMSKLDRFLISESLMSSCPNISAITLDRFLSDHRLILLKESKYDYGPILFLFFHYWFEVDGFVKLVEETWNEALGDTSNSIFNLMKKLKFLKKKTRAWNIEKKKSSKTSMLNFKTELAELDAIIDKGEGNDDVIHKRKNVVESILKVKKLQSMEAAQKAKIKWAIEGDENSKYYHGILNKKQNQLAIRGFLIKGN